ncbi:MAG: hypothetical protein LBR36_02950 [Bacteroidales bacterium]|jgi:hypothetical protein|nr:hypothetical protein [Bacteroidales bacterium]
MFEDDEDDLFDALYNNYDNDDDSDDDEINANEEEEKWREQYLLQVENNLRSGNIAKVDLESIIDLLNSFYETQTWLEIIWVCNISLQYYKDSILLKVYDILAHSKLYMLSKEEIYHKIKDIDLNDFRLKEELSNYQEEFEYIFICAYFEAFIASDHLDEALSIAKFYANDYTRGGNYDEVYFNIISEIHCLKNTPPKIYYQEEVVQYCNHFLDGSMCETFLDVNSILEIKAKEAQHTQYYRDFLEYFLQKNPCIEYAWEMLGRSYLIYPPTDYEKAIEALQNAVAITNEIGVALMLDSLALSYYLGGYPQKALAACKEKLSLCDKKDITATSPLVRLAYYALRIKKNIKESYQYIHLALRERETVLGYWVFANICMDDNNYEQALDCLNSGVILGLGKSIMKTFEFMLLRADCLLELEDYDEAIDTLEACMTLVDQYMDMRPVIRLAECYARQEQYDRVADILANAIEKNEAAGRLKAEPFPLSLDYFIFRAAAYYFLAKNYEEARYLYQKAYQNSPEYASHFWETIIGVVDLEYVISTHAVDDLIANMPLLFNDDKKTMLKNYFKLNQMLEKDFDIVPF